MKCKMTTFTPHISNFSKRFFQTIFVFVTLKKSTVDLKIQSIVAGTYNNVICDVILEGAFPKILMGLRRGCVLSHNSLANILWSSRDTDKISTFTRLWRVFHMHKTLTSSPHLGDSDELSTFMRLWQVSNPHKTLTTSSLHKTSTSSLPHQIQPQPSSQPSQGSIEFSTLTRLRRFLQLTRLQRVLDLHEPPTSVLTHEPPTSVQYHEPPTSVQPPRSFLECLTFTRIHQVFNLHEYSLSVRSSRASIECSPSTSSRCSRLSQESWSSQVVFCTSIGLPALPNTNILEWQC